MPSVESTINDIKLLGVEVQEKILSYLDNLYNYIILSWRVGY